MQDPKSENAYLGDRARSYDRLRFTSPSGIAIHDAEVRIFRSVLDGMPPRSRVLEVGCGTGRFLVEAGRGGMECAGVDPSGDMLAETAAKLREHGFTGELRQGTGQQLPFADGEFDLVYSIRALNQMGTRENALKAVAEMVRVCRPGGKVLVEFVNAARRPLRPSARDVYLWPREVIDAAVPAASVAQVIGAFFFGMTAIHRAPGWLLRPLVAIDTALSRRLPKVCARCYALISKPAGAAR